MRTADGRDAAYWAQFPIAITADGASVRPHAMGRRTWHPLSAPVSLTGHHRRWYGGVLIEFISDEVVAASQVATRSLPGFTAFTQNPVLVPEGGGPPGEIASAAHENEPDSLCLVVT